MDGIVGDMRHAHQILRVKDYGFSLDHILNSNRVQMVNENAIREFMAGKSEIATIIPNDYFVPQLSPFIGVVEGLIEEAIVTERVTSNHSIKLEICESFFKGGNRDEFRICFNIHLHHLLDHYIGA